MPRQSRAVPVRQRTSIRAALLAASAGISLVHAPVVQAQTEQAEQAPEGGIGDIIVTARKRQETTQDVPVSVVAISAERMQQYDLSNLACFIHRGG